MDYNGPHSMRFYLDVVVLSQAMGVVDECLSKNTDTDQPVEPASIDRQREILARPPLTQEQPKDEKYDFRKRTWRPRQKGDPPPRRRTDGSKTNRANVEKPDWKTWRVSGLYMGLFLFFFFSRKVPSTSMSIILVEKKTEILRNRFGPLFTTKDNGGPS